MSRCETEMKHVNNTYHMRLERAEKVRPGVKKEYDIVQRMKSQLKGQVWGPIFNEVT